MSDGATTSPAKKATLRDAKVGAEFIYTLGYGGVRAAFVGKVVENTRTSITYKVTWGPGKGAIEKMAKPEASYAIKTGLMRFDVDRLDKETGLIKERAMTVDEAKAANEADARWKKFTESETYQCQ